MAIYMPVYMQHSTGGRLIRWVVGGSYHVVVLYCLVLCFLVVLFLFFTYLHGWACRHLSTHIARVLQPPNPLKSTRFIGCLPCRP